MKERPILMSAPMVRAILEGRKTQTRRIIKGLHPGCFSARCENGLDWKFYDQFDRLIQATRCKFGIAEDRLWVREAWRIGAWNEDTSCVAIDYLADGYLRQEWLEILDEDVWQRYWIQSTDDAIAAGLQIDSDGRYYWKPGQSPCRKRPSMFMPRRASRITLEVTGVRVEQLQDISEQDAMAEGITAEELFCAQGCSPKAYRKLWESLNGPGSWGSNPWVWVVEFKRAQP